MVTDIPLIREKYLRIQLVLYGVAQPSSDSQGWNLPD